MGVDESNAKNGTLKQSYQGTHRGGFREIVPNTVRWNTRIDNDRELRIEFEQKVVTQQSSNIENHCSNQTFHSKLETLKNEIRARAEFVVPDGVYLLRIKQVLNSVESRTENRIRTHVSKLVSTATDLDQNGNIRSGRPDYDLPKGLNMKVGEFEYFFVRPGERVEFDVAWNSTERNDSKMKVGFDLSMMGYDGCGQLIGNLQGQSGVSVSKLMSQISSTESINENPHKFIEAMSCLRNPVYVDSMIYTNHGSQLISSLSELQNSFEKWEVDFSKETQKRYYEPIRTTFYMTLLEVSRNLLRDLTVYCDTKSISELFGLPAGRDYKIKGYTYTAQLYGKIRFLIHAVPIDILESYVSSLEYFHNQKMTYEDVNRQKSAMTVLHELSLTLQGINFESTEAIRRWVQYLPSAKSNGQARNAITASITNMEEASRIALVEFRQSLVNFKRNSNDVVDFNSLKNAVNQLKQSRNNVLALFNADFDWFLSGNYSVGKSTFLEQTEQLAFDIVASSTDILSTFHGKKLSTSIIKWDFLRISETEKLIQDAKLCLGAKL